MHNNGLQCSRRGGVPITKGEIQIQKTEYKYKYKMHNNGLQCSRRGGVPITRGESGLRATAAGSSRLL